MKVYFLLQSDKPDANIYVRLTDGTAVDQKAKTGYVIDPQYWQLINRKSKKESLIGKPGRPHTAGRDAATKQMVTNLNAKLDRLSGRIKDAYNDTPQAEIRQRGWLKSLLAPTVTTLIPDTLIEYFGYYIKAKKADSSIELTKATYVKLNVVKHLLERFEKASYKKSKIKILEIDHSFKVKFFEYCNENGYATNTTSRSFKFIKTVAYAYARETKQQLDLKDLSVVIKPVPKIYLTPVELDAIEAKEFKLDHLDNARDWLLISCDTAQRVSDFMRFEGEYVRDKGGVPMIDIVQKKTGAKVAVPLSERVMRILAKRNGQFPRRISDVNYNLYIKKVCKEAGITQKVKGGLVNKKTNRKEDGVYEKYKLIGSHVGRRSFASNNYGLHPTPLLMAVTAHSTERAFLEYIGKSQDDLAHSLAKRMREAELLS
jgi:integrase